MKNVVEIIFLCVSILGGVLALRTYRKQAQTRRAEWLVDLYDKFFEGNQYKTIRRILDYRQEPDYTIIQHAIASGKPDDRVESLVDYLNFFEFVAGLQLMKQITNDEVERLFQYYLNNLKDHEFVKTYICEEGFEDLAKLLNLANAETSVEGSN